MYDVLSSAPTRKSPLLSPAHAAKYFTEVAAEEAKKSLRTFCKRAWRILLPTDVIWNWHMDAICEHLAYVTLGEIRFLMINVPPRLSKTMIVSVLWPAWHWLHKPGEQFLTASVDAALSTDSAILSRRLIESDWYARQWPGQIILYDDENTAGMFRNRKGGYRMTASVQGRVTGVGGTLQIGDDFHDAKKVESDKVRRASISWHDNAWRSRLNNPDQAQKVYVGQRTHEVDIYGHVIAQEGKRWCHFKLPMEFNPSKRCITYLNKGTGPITEKGPIFQDPRKVENEVIDPKRMGAETVNSEKAIVSERSWQAQYNQEPVGEGGFILKRQWWRPWVEPKWRSRAGQERPMPRFREILQVYDTAFEPDEEADFSARTTWGIFEHAEQLWDENLQRPVVGKSRTCAMLLDSWRDRVGFPELREECIEANIAFAPDVILIEKKASGHSLVQELKRKRLPVKAVNLAGSAGRKGVSGDLVTRAHSSSLMLEKGCIWYPPRRFAYDVIEEASKFPNADHDDWVSTLVMAWMYMRRYWDLELPDDERDEISPWAWKQVPRKLYA